MFWFSTPRRNNNAGKPLPAALLALLRRASRYSIHTCTWQALKKKYHNTTLNP